MSHPHHHPFIPATLIGYALFLFFCGAVSFFTLPAGQGDSSYSTFVFGVVVIIWAISIKQDKEWGFTLSIYTIILAMFAYFMRGFMYLIRYSQGDHEKLGLSVWGWILSAGSIFTLFFLFRLTRIKARPRKPEIQAP
ncbi:MAG: hypothetical protein SGI98_06230 [Verrucomicrobiota bacterium]|nr:hypothetical protein [Verrucomicrobiota bacterium]